jgi:2-dehydro-3-deoxygalactonokinase
MRLGLLVELHDFEEHQMSCSGRCGSPHDFSWKLQRKVFVRIYGWLGQLFLALLEPPLLSGIRHLFKTSQQCRTRVLAHQFLYVSSAAGYFVSSLFQPIWRTAPMNPPVLISLDWGTSNLRASLLDGNAKEMEKRSAPTGIMNVTDGLFSRALSSLIGDWIVKYPCPLIASGMIGSRQGWREAPYLDCPASVESAARSLTRVEIEFPGKEAARRELCIVPGLKCMEADGQYDVMRGEETQIWGAGKATSGLFVLPGTHSKWAWVDQNGSIGRFRTYMTGELYGVLTQHSILGRLMTFGVHSAGDFTRGVQIGLKSAEQVSHVIFTARTAGLMGTIAPEGLPDYLSGILTGIEVAAATAAHGAPLPAVSLIGDEVLCSRYEHAFELAGVPTSRAPADSTARGHWTIAKKAGLI